MLLLACVISVTACGGDDGGTLGGSVVGSWRRVPSSFADSPPPVAAREVITFASAGTYTIVEDSRTEAGTYTTTDGDLTLVDSSDPPRTLTLPYYASGARFVFGALTSSDADGMVGTWSGSISEDGVGIDSTVILAADHSGSFAQHRDDGQAVAYDGTWSAQGDDVELVLPLEGATLHLQATLVDGVLGSPYERL